MRDIISIARVTELHPAIRDEVPLLIDKAEAKLGPRCAIRVVEWLRTIPYQNALYAIGRTVKGKNPRPAKPMGDTVTKARGGYSFHNYGLAIDFAILYDKDGNGTYESLSWDTLKDFNMDGESDWKEVVEIFEAAGYTWGGDWVSIKDNPHLEKKFGYPEDCHALLAKYVNKDFISGTTYLNL